MVHHFVQMCLLDKAYAMIESMPMELNVIKQRTFSVPVEHTKTKLGEVEVAISNISYQKLRLWLTSFKFVVQSICLPDPCHITRATHTTSLYSFICQGCGKARVLEDKGALSHGFFHLSTPFPSHRLVRAAKKLGFFFFGRRIQKLFWKKTVLSSSVFTAPSKMRTNLFFTNNLLWQLREHTFFFHLILIVYSNTHTPSNLYDKYESKA